MCGVGAGGRSLWLVGRPPRSEAQAEGSVGSVPGGEGRITSHEGIPPSEQPIIATTDMNSGFSKSTRI